MKMSEEAKRRNTEMVELAIDTARTVFNAPLGGGNRIGVIVVAFDQENPSGLACNYGSTLPVREQGIKIMEELCGRFRAQGAGELPTQ